MTLVLVILHIMKKFEMLYKKNQHQDTNHIILLPLLIFCMYNTNRQLQDHHTESIYSTSLQKSDEKKDLSMEFWTFLCVVAFNILYPL